MFIRATDSRFWSRPIILLPSAFLGDPANRYGGMPASGVEEITPDTSEGQPSLPTADLDGHSSAADAFMASQPYLIPGAMPMDSFFATNSSSSAAKPRHRKNRSTKTIVKAEDIPEYKGQMPVDDLVNFINSGKSKKASVKKKMVKTNGRAEQSDGKTNGDTFSSSVEFDETEERNSEKAETEKESIFNEKSVGQHVEMETPASTTDSRTEGEVFPADSSYWKDFTPVRRRKKGKIQQQMEDDGRASNSAVSLGHTKSRDYTNPIIRETKPSHFAANKHETPPLNNVKINKPNPEVSHSSQASCNCLHSPLKSCTSNACKNHETLRKRERCDVLKMNDMRDIVTKNDNQCSIVNSMTSHVQGGNCPAAGITSQPEPVIFVDRKDKGYTKIDISFGFDVQDSDCGSNEPSEVDVVLPESCSCRIIQHSPSNAGSLLGSREGIGDSVSVNDTDENNNHEKHHGHGCCHTIKQAKSTPPTALLHGPEASHLSVPTKRISTSSPNEGRIDSLIPNVKCSVHCNCSGRPISVVAPNQPLNGNTHNRLISTLNQGTVTGQKQPLGTVKQQESVHSASPCACIVPSLGHNVGQTLSCSPATGSCGPAPVLKVAPMLVENLGTTSLATDESVDGPVKEDISRKSSILNSKDNENGQQKHIKAESGDYQENPQNENERTETVEINKETQSPIDQICSTVDDKNFHHSISPQDRLTFSQPQSQVPDQNDPLANEEEEEEEEESVSSDVTANHIADVCPDVSHHPAEDRFDLFFAQIFLYKTYEDCISAPYTVVRKIRTTDSNE